MKKTVLITTLTFNFLLFTFNSLAQPAIQWEKSLGGSGADIALSVEQTIDGGYIVAGQSSSNDGDVTANYGGTDCWVVKIDAVGNIQWEKNIGGTGNESVNDVHQTIDKGFIIVGFTNSNDIDVTFNNGGSDVWIVKMDSIGNIEWQQSYGGSNSEDCESILQTIDGGYIFLGSTLSFDGDVSSNNGSYDMWVVKIDSIGNILWERNYGGSNNESGKSIAVTFDGGYIITGDSDSNNGDVSNNYGNGDYWVVKIDSIGNILWERNYGGSSTDSGKTIKQMANGNYFVSGSSLSNDIDVSGHYGSTSVYDCWVIKLDFFGNILWETSIGGTSMDLTNGMQLTNDDGIIIINESSSNDGNVSGNYGSWDYWVVKIDSLGNIEWEKNLGGSFGDWGYAINTTNDGGCVVAGMASSVDFDVTGSMGGGDFWVAKLDPVVGIEGENQDEKQLLIYPNPTNGQIMLTTKSDGRIELFDVTGRKLMKQSVNTTNTTIDLSHLSKGIYILHFLTNKELFTQKIILK